MKCVYKVLLPIYREQEMTSEIEQEWLMDCAGHSELTLHLFSKLLFRIAHQWSTHINIDEYCELMMKIFQRITIRKVIRAANSQVILAMPTITIEIVTPEIDGVDQFASSEQEELSMFEPCQSDEEEKAEFDYHYIENTDNLTVKKHKKRKPLLEKKEEGDMEDEGDQHIPLFPVKEPIQYREEVVYHQNSGDYRPVSDDHVSYILADFSDIFPFGYPTEQFLTWMKNDVNEKFEASKKARKDALAKMKREALDGGSQMKEGQIKKEEDTGLIQFSGKVLYFHYEMITKDNSKVRTRAKMVDILFNALRMASKDAINLSLRLDMVNPKAAIRDPKTKIRAPVGGTEPVTEINKFGYNPAVERRVSYKNLPMYSQGGNVQWVNINYILHHPDFETAQRCDVQKYENANKLNVKKTDDFKREEDFVALETSFKKTRQIMLQKKFETLYTENLNADESDLKRIDKIADRES